ncbi:MAG: glycosyl hydrolase family 28-related protein, partial [Terracidiphilus sp.]
DSTFTGQRRAAIHTQEAGMTLVRDRISHTPVAIEIASGKTEELYARDLVLEDVTRAAVVLGDAQKPHNEITLDHIVCRGVPQLVETPSGAQPGTPAIFHLKGSSHSFIEEHLTIGEMIGPDGRERGIQLHHRERSGAAQAVPSDIPPLPPMREWVNVHTLGVKGDGSDDTAALQSAIDAHRVLYFPSGTYRVMGTLHLRPESVLIGFNPGTTVIAAVNESSSFTGEGAPVPVIESAKGGAAVVTGIGITTAELNHRVVGILWRAGPHSMVEDVNLRMGFAFRNPVLAPNLPQPAQRPSRQNFAAFRRRLQESMDTQYPSLWVTDGGGGIFRGIWTSNTLAKAGLLVDNTTTPSTVYQLSCEHHMHHETEFHNASNWTVYALQTEEENPAGVDSYSIDLDNARHMLFANTFMYRVSRQVLPKLNAVESTASKGIQFENVHTFSMTRLAYDNSVFDHTSGVRVRDHDFTAFAIHSDLKTGAPLPLPVGIFAPGAKLQQLAGDFSNADGLTVDDAGDLYFTDAAMHRVYRWNADAKKPELLTDKINNPMAAAFAGNSALLVLDYSRAVYAVDTKTGATTKVDPADTPISGTSLLLPVGLHNTIETL